MELKYKIGVNGNEVVDITQSLLSMRSGDSFLVKEPETKLNSWKSMITGLYRQGRIKGIKTKRVGENLKIYKE